MHHLRPIIVLLVSLIGGIVLGCQIPGQPIGLWLVAFVAAAFIVINLIRKKPSGFTPLLLFVALGYASVQPWISPNFPANHIQHYSDQTRWQIIGVVDSHPVEFKYFKRFVLRADTLKHKKKSYRVSGRIRVTVRGKSPAIARGDRVMLRSRLRQIRNFNNPGGFNYRRYMAFKGIWRTAYTKGNRLQIVQKESSKNLVHRLNDARQAVSALIERAGKGPSVAVLKALVIGDRTAISSEIRNRFNRTGVGHILAISGLHIGIVATIAFLFFKNMLGFFKPLLWRAWTWKGAAVLSLVPVLIYGLISGMSPSTQRAVIMVIAFLITFLVNREHEALNTLALAAFIILVVYPPSLFSISFQLSFMAVLSIFYGLSCIQNQPPAKRPSSKSGLGIQLRRRMITFFLVSFFAICGTLPLVMFYFNQISVIGLFANFIMVPLVGFVVVPCGLVALFIYPLSSQLAFGCVKICIFVLDQALVIIKYLAGLPFAAVKTITPSLFEMGCYYVLGWAVLNWVKSKKSPAVTRSLTGAEVDRNVPKDGHVSRMRAFGFFRLIKSSHRWLLDRFAGKRVAVIGIVVLSGLLADTGYWLIQRHWNADLTVTFIDVGQGNAALLELPDGHTMLIDGGGFSDNNAFDMGARVIAPFLWQKKIQTIDTLVLSHPNSDHLNGLIFIAQHFNVKTIWTNGEARSTLGYKRFRKIIAQKQLNLPDFKHMPRRHLINGVHFSFLYPPADFLAIKTDQKWRTSNNNSLVLKVAYGDISFLFPGDIMAKAEKELVDLSGVDLACDVLLVPHHGSRSSSTPIFLANVQPDIAVISAGWKNRFRFPHPTVLEAYEKRGCRIFRTDRNGAVHISTDGKRLTLEPFISADDSR